MCLVTSVIVLLVLVSGSYGDSSYQQDLNNKNLHKVREQKLETILENFMIHVDERFDQMEDAFYNTTAEIQKNLRENVESTNMNVETMMQIQANNSQQYDLNLKEVDFRTVDGKAGGTSSYSDADAPIGAFRGVDVYWHSGVPTLPQAIWFHFNQTIKVVIYSFKSRDADASNLIGDGPSKYEFFGSNARDCSDQSSWVVLKQDHSGTPFTTKYDFRIEYVTHPDFYSCYGFKIIDVPGRSDGNKWVVINNVHFLH